MRKILVIIGLVLMFGFCKINKIEAVSGTCACNGGYVNINTDGCDAGLGKAAYCTGSNSCSCFTVNEWNAFKNRTGTVTGTCTCLGGYADQNGCDFSAGKEPRCVSATSCICLTNTEWSNYKNRGSSSHADDAVLPTYDSKDYISPFKFKDADMGTVIGKVIGYVYIFAGFGLLLVLLMGGFAVMTSAGAPEKAKMGYDRITQGVTGFLLIFVSYLIVLVVQATFKVKIFF